MAHLMKATEAKMQPAVWRSKASPCHQQSRRCDSLCGGSANHNYFSNIL